jgi:hypothetical protein
MNTEVKDILGILEELNVSSGFDVFIPSLKKEIKFKHLSTEQLKSVLKTVVDSPIYNSQFTTTVNRVISENCLDSTLDTKSLTIYDKLFILFKTRIESVSTDYSFEFTEEEIKEHSLNLDDTKKKIIDLSEHFNKFTKKQYEFLPETIEHGTCSIVCDLPSIETENKLEKELHKNVKIEVESPEELREIVGETFINEITKYVVKIVTDKNTVDLGTLDFKTRIKIVEQLPTNIINKVIKFIENYRNKTKELTTVNVLGVDKDISLDASFFNM